MNPSLHLTPRIERMIREQAVGDAVPMYLYDVDAIRQICRALQAIPYPQKSIHLAIQANAHPSFLRIMREEGVNIFVNSALHLRVALDNGFSGKEIVYTASALDAGTMHEIHAAGAMVNLDSNGQIEQWQRLFPETPFGIRSNIGTLVKLQHTHGGFYIGRESRLGLLPDEIRALGGNPRVAGLHLYVGTDIQSIAYFRECYEALCTFAAHFPALEYLNFGGGFSLRGETGAPFDFAAYGRMVTEVMDTVSAAVARPLRLMLEPGRVIAGNAGYFVCRVVDVKMIEGKQFIGVNASSAQFPRPLFHPDFAFHPVTLLRTGETPDTLPAYPGSVYGCSTYSSDFLASEVHLPQARPGDLIVLGEAGSYCASSYTQFLGFPPAKECFA